MTDRTRDAELPTREQLYEELVGIIHAARARDTVATSSRMAAYEGKISQLLLVARRGVEANEDAERLDRLEADAKDASFGAEHVRFVGIYLREGQTLRAAIDEHRAARVPDSSLEKK